MNEKTRRRLHLGLALFFAIQVPIALFMQFMFPAIFEVVWKQYLIFLSIYAIVSTHLVGASAETPDDDSG